MPQKTRDHYIIRFKKFIVGWKRRGYNIIPDESPQELESKCCLKFKMELTSDTYTDSTAPPFGTFCAV